MNLPPSLSVFVCLSVSVTQTHTHTHTVVRPTGPRCLFPFTRPPEAFGCTRPPHPHPHQLGSPLHCAEPPTPLRCLRLRASLSLSPFKGHILVLTLLTNPMSISCLFSSSLLRHAHLPGSPGSPAPHVLRRPIPGRVPRLLPAPRVSSRTPRAHVLGFSCRLRAHDSPGWVSGPVWTLWLSCRIARSLTVTTVEINSIG